MNSNVLVLFGTFVAVLGNNEHKSGSHRGYPPISFTCPPLPPLERPARNVYELRPQDIKVAMALGDSITAGFGIMGVHDDPILDLFEYRGKSFSIGGDAGANTIASWLRNYNKDLVGMSVGSHVAELCYGEICSPDQYHPDKDVLNAAQSGAMIPNLVKHELKYLLEQLKRNTKIDMENDWKLLTILVGANDVCLGCSGDVPYLTADDYEKYMTELMEEIHNNIPKVFVNYMLLFNVSQVYDISMKSDYCKDVHRVLGIECVCVFEGGEKTRVEVGELTRQFNDRAVEVAKKFAGKYDDFAVVIQPCVADGTAATLTPEVISTVDCFHPSLLMHELMTKVLWNNMFTPSSGKDSTFNFSAPLKCPTNETLLYTN
ncbi:phospholipase B1, membrane-associated-like [Dysidea avara]|uniref:phospholipase B1, membrane-associated-like n=1 Tax=Dysidea avara TaxID=196820 RepID=UPI003332F470